MVTNLQEKSQVLPVTLQFPVLESTVTNLQEKSQVLPVTLIFRRRARDVARTHVRTTPRARHVTQRKTQNRKAKIDFPVGGSQGLTPPTSDFSCVAAVRLIFAS